MVLAAGLGTRLRPLTDDRPKALVEVAGRTLLEITLSRLRLFGIRDVIINVHHFSDLVVGYLKANQNFGMHIEVSCERILLDTGGGLKKAAPFFLEDPLNRHEPFVLHNVDVISTIDLRQMLLFHEQSRALATLAVQQRETSRYLLFDENLRLCGWKGRGDQTPEPGKSRQPQPLAFSGIHIISPRFLEMITEQGAFSIIAPYLRLAGLGKKIVPFRADGYYWQDLGKPENLAQVSEDVKQGVLLLD